MHYSNLHKDLKRKAFLLLNLKHLHYFYITIEEQGISRAAKRLRISQPALSNQLKTFSVSVGERLFTYDGQNLILTPRGRLVYFYAKQIFATYDELNRTLANQQPDREARLRVGFSDDIDRVFAMNLIFRLLSENAKLKKVSFYLTTGNVEFLKQKTLANELDLVIATNSEDFSAFKVLFENKTPVNLFLHSSTLNLLRSELDMISPQDHRARFELLQAAGIRLALPSPGLQLRMEIDRFLRTHNIRPRLLLEVDFIVGISQAITTGVAMSIVPSLYVSDALHRGIVEAVGPAEGYWAHSVSVLVRESNQIVGRYHDLFGVLKTYIAA
jgi:LysR family transcriptional activator of nhaA